MPPGEDYVQSTWNYMDPNKHDPAQQNVTLNASSNSKPAKDENKGLLIKMSIVFVN